MARDIASSLLNDKTVSEESNLRGSSYEIEPFRDGKNNDLFYIINFSDWGFLLLSGDRRAEPVLAFAEKGEFRQVQHYPEGLEFWLEETEKMFHNLRTASYEVNEAAWDLSTITKIVRNKNINSIANLRDEPPTGGGCSPTTIIKGPLMQTLWNQDNGYNDYVPHLSCSTPSNGHAYTGCVATAMAQIMKYQNKPSSFNWSQMPTGDNSSHWTRTLMQDIGSKVSMNYGCYSNNGSGASMNHAKNAFINDYGYSSAQRTNINYSTLKNQIDASRPVMMAGGSHAWVCDGYQSYKDSYCTEYLQLYMNWGWGGSYNALYSISSFNPGGSNYNSNVEFIYNLY